MASFQLSILLAGTRTVLTGQEQKLEETLAVLAQVGPRAKVRTFMQKCPGMPWMVKASGPLLGALRMRAGNGRRSLAASCLPVVACRVLQ